MKIWYLNHYAKPPTFGISGRPFYLSKALAKLGIEVLVIGASQHHNRIKPAPAGDINRVRAYDDVNYFHIPCRSYKGNGLLRLLNMLDYARGVRKLTKLVCNGVLCRPDIIIPSCVHIFAYPPAYSLSKKFNSKLIYEVRDIWPLSLVELAGISKWHPLVLWMSLIEKNAYKRSDAVVSLLPLAFEHMHSKGLNKSKFYHIPNGVYRAEWDMPMEPLPAEHQRVFDVYRHRGKMIVVYAGAHGIPNALDQILDLNKIIAGKEAPYHFILIGDGSEKDKLVKRKTNENLNFLSFLPRVPKQTVLTAIKQADVCFVGLRKSPIYRFGVSLNKVGDYLVAGKPVIWAANVGNNIIETAGAGITVEPDRPDQLDEALRQFVQMQPDEMKRIGESGRKYALENLEWSILGRQYAELCSTLLSS